MDPVIAEAIKAGGFLAVAVGAIYLTREVLSGRIVPRTFYDQEHNDRIAAESREKELGKLFGVALEELRKARGA